jgi:uncharacterized protein (TIGR00299 family) protein
MPSGRHHFHLDPLGGAAGDMFAACVLDAFPGLAEGAIAAAKAAAGVDCRLIPHRDHGLTGSRFAVGEAQSHEDNHHHHHHDAPHDHGHARWSRIRADLETAALAPAVRTHAIGIFTLLAEAEARVHGIPVAEVAFHEVGAADSIADIVAAAWLIEALSPASWSLGPLPLGGGSVRTAHGVMPVPAPATALLLEGFAMTDDGIAGERVTPTGAAILRYLAPVARPSSPGLLRQTGMGFGTRHLPGTSNVLRLLAFAPSEDAPGLVPHRELAVIAFEVDDQTAEDLAIALERLRALPGVHDALQMAAWGKKGRMAAHVQVLARPDVLEAVVESCFRETTTIGLRTHLVHGRALTRRMHTVRLDGNAMRVKVVDRPGGRSGKTEAEDLVSAEGQTARMARRLRAQQMAEDDDV